MGDSLSASEALRGFSVQSATALSSFLARVCVILLNDTGHAPEATVRESRAQLRAQIQATWSLESPRQQ